MYTMEVCIVEVAGTRRGPPLAGQASLPSDRYQSGKQPCAFNSAKSCVMNFLAPTTGWPAGACFTSWPYGAPQWTLTPLP